VSTLSCPQCGTPHTPINPGIALIACDACGATLYREGDLLRAGVQARLAEPRSALRVGSTGTVGDRRLTLLGRAGFSWGDGRWDEWAAVDEASGEAGWLVEDARRYTFERPILPPEGAGQLSSVGQQIRAEGATFEVRELGTAVCEGAEGQLPRPVRPTETYRYIDLDELGGSRRLLLEIDPDGTVEAFVGQAYTPSQVDFGAVIDSTEGAGRAPEASTVTCPQCGAPAEVPVQGDPVHTLACGYCDAVFEPSGEVGALLGRRGETPPYVLEVGDRGALRGVTWEVVGRLHHVEPDGWASSEFLLWNPDAGYVWLEESYGHVVAFTPAVQTPSLSEIEYLSPGGVCRIDGHRFRMVERGSSRLEHVDGALPWAAKIGERFGYVDLIDPPRVASVELGTHEAEFFTGEWLDGQEVLSAFGRADRHQPPRSRHPAQPNPYRGWLAAAGVAVAMAILNCGLGGVLHDNGDLVLEQTLSISGDVGTAAVLGADSPNYAADDVLTRPFPLDPADGVASVIELQASSLDNAWAWVGVELLPVSDAFDPDDIVPAGVMSGEISYYHGVEGGESWSEGSRSRSITFRTPEAGQYQLRLGGESLKPTRVNVRVYNGFVSGSWNIAVAFLGFFVGGMIGFAYMGFEGSRIDTDDEDD